MNKFYITFSPHHKSRVGESLDEMYSEIECQDEHQAGAIANSHYPKWAMIHRAENFNKALYKNGCHRRFKLNIE